MCIITRRSEQVCEMNEKRERVLRVHQACALLHTLFLMHCNKHVLCPAIGMMADSHRQSRVRVQTRILNVYRNMLMICASKRERNMHLKMFSWRKVVS